VACAFGLFHQKCTLTVRDPALWFLHSLPGTQSHITTVKTPQHAQPRHTGFGSLFAFLALLSLASAFRLPLRKGMVATKIRANWCRERRQAANQRQCTQKG
jgi:hypothetical protein